MIAKAGSGCGDRIHGSTFSTRDYYGLVNKNVATTPAVSSTALGSILYLCKLRTKPIARLLVSFINQNLTYDDIVFVTHQV